MFWRQRFQFEEFRLLCRAIFETDLRNLIEKRTIFHFLYAVLLSSSAAVGIVSSIRLSDKDTSFRIDGKAVQQRPKRIDGFHQFVCIRIKNKQITVRYFWMFDNVRHMPQR